MDQTKTAALACTEVLPKDCNAIGSVIWLHGLGADGNDFLPIIDALDIPNKDKIRFIFPTAPKRPITVNNGELMNGWYDIVNIGEKTEEDKDGIHNSHTLIEKLIDREISEGIEAKKIILGGFSQGGAISIYTGLRLNKRLGGIISLSSYCVLEKEYEEAEKDFNQDLPIFIGHGMFDPLVPLHLGDRAKSILSKQSNRLEYKTYPIQHNVSEDEVLDISQFLIKTLELR